MSEFPSSKSEFDTMFWQIEAAYEAGMSWAERIEKLVAEYTRDGEIRTSGMTTHDFVRIEIPFDHPGYPGMNLRLITGFMDGQNMTVKHDTVQELGLKDQQIVLGSWVVDESGETMFVKGRLNETDRAGYSLTYGNDDDVVDLGAPPQSFDFNGTTIFGESMSS